MENARKMWWSVEKINFVVFEDEILLTFLYLYYLLAIL